MKKKLFILALSLSSFCLSASHYLGGYFEHHVDTVNQLWNISLHIIGNSPGAAINQNSVTLNGPFSVNLFRVSGQNTLVPYGDPNCSAGDYYEIVFTGSIPLSSSVTSIWNDLLPKTWTYTAPCCVPSSENVTSASTLHLELSIRPQVGNMGQPIFPYIDTRGSHPEMVQNAYPNIRNYNDFGHRSQLIGIDSVSSTLVGVKNTSSTFAPYASGYSGLFPLPDQTEDSLNGAILFFPNQRIISAQARAGSYTPGRYLVNFVTEYFKNQRHYFFDYALAAVYYIGQDSLADTTYIKAEDASQSYPAQSSNQNLNYTLNYGDFLNLDLKAFAGLGDTIRLIEFKEDYDTAGLSPSVKSSLNLPQLISQNFNGLISAADTNKLRLSFNPNINNFTINASQYTVTLFFSNKFCEGNVASIRVRINLSPENYLTVNQLNLDSVLFCDPQTIALRKVGANSNFYWSPGNWVNDSLAAQTSLTSPASGWLYLIIDGGTRADSLYLKNDSVSTISAPQLGLADDIIVLDSMPSFKQSWTVSSFVEVNSPQEDQIPILGAGTYKINTRYSPLGCLATSGEIEVPEDFLWGTNYGADGYHVDQSIVDTSGSKINYTCKLEIPGETRFFEKIFFFGFENLNPQVPKEISLKITTNYGYQDSLVALITSEGYLEFPVNFDLAPNLSAILEVELDSGIAYHYLSYNQSGFLRNALRFTELGYTTAGGTINYGRRIPLGFKYQGTVGLSSPEDLLVQVYPNPSSGEIRIDWPFKENGLAEVYNQQGQKVATIRLKEGKQIGGFNLAAGLYSLVFRSHPHLKSVKLLIKN